MIVVIIPDGGRSYLSKIYSDGWMRQYGFLERGADLTVGDVLRRKREAGEIPSLVTVEPHFRVREAVALLHEHRVSQLPVVSAHDPSTIVGAIGERGLLRHAAEDPALLDAEIVRRDGATVRRRLQRRSGARGGGAAGRRAAGAGRHRPGPGRGAGDPHRPAGGAGHVSGEPAPRDAFATRAVHAGLTPDPVVWLGHPGHPSDLHLRAAAAR